MMVTFIPSFTAKEQNVSLFCLQTSISFCISLYFCLLFLRVSVCCLFALSSRRLSWCCFPLLLPLSQTQLLLFVEQYVTNG